MLSRVGLFVTPQTALSMESPGQEYCSGLPFPSPGDLPRPGSRPESPVAPALAGEFFTAAPGPGCAFKCSDESLPFPSQITAPATAIIYDFYSPYEENILNC